MRSSNASALEAKDTLDRLRCRLLTPSPGDVGWDVFLLAYEMGSSGPVSLVVTSAASAAYSRLFLFLWRVRRVERALGAAWAAAAGGGHALAASGLQRGSVLSLSLGSKPSGLEPGSELSNALHAAALLRTDMHNFVSTLQSYLCFEVLAPGWVALEDDISHATSLNAVIAAHAAYLTGLTDRALLSSRTAALGEPLAALLDECLRFTELQAELVTSTVEQASIRSQA